MKSFAINIIKSQRFFWLIIFQLILKFLTLFGENLLINFVFNLALALLLFETIKFFYNNFNEKKAEPINLFLNIGIMAGILLLLETFSGNVLSNWFSELLKGKIESGNVRLLIISSFYSVIFIFFISYVSAILIYIFFLRQKRNLNVYFYTMWSLIFLSSFSKLIDNDDLRFIKNTFFTVAIIVIFFNSLRISWIAFLSKKQKIYILFISIGLLFLFIVLLSVFSENSKESVLILTLSEFSPILVGLKSLIFTYCSIYFAILFFVTLFNLPTSEAFERKAQEISSLQSLSNILTQVFNFSELSETISLMTTQVCHSDASWIRIKGKSSQFINYSLNKITYQEEEFISNLIISKINSNELTPNGSVNLKKLKPDSGKKIDTKHNLVLYSQLKVQNEIIGYLFTTRMNGLNFDTDEENVIRTFAEYSAIAFHNNRLYNELIEKERLEKELDVARDIQMRIIPQDVPKLKDFEIATSFIPAFEVGGDYFDFFDITEDKMAVVIADVSGKGIGAAFYMAEVKGIFESLSKTLSDPKEILIKANEILKKSMNRKSFVTATYCIIDKKNWSIKMCRAGHCHPILFNEAGIYYIKSNGMGLGLDDTEIFRNSLEQIEFFLKKNDMIILITDGISEAKNKIQEDYGYTRLENIILNNRETDVDTLARNIIEDIIIFAENGQQYDDITLVIIKCTGKSE